MSKYSFRIDNPYSFFDTPGSYEEFIRIMCKTLNLSSIKDVRETRQKIGSTLELIELNVETLSNTYTWKLEWGGIDIYIIRIAQILIDELLPGYWILPCHLDVSELLLSIDDRAD